MKCRKATKADICRIMEIIRDAQKYLRDNNINQWQNNYPNTKVIHLDVLKNESYVIEKDGLIVGTFALSVRDNKNYTSIHEGQWLNHGRHSTIHRVAIDRRYKGNGLASEIVKIATQISLEKFVDSIRVDTHEDNISMQKILGKNNFQYCGITYLEDKSPRISFEKVI